MIEVFVSFIGGVVATEILYFKVLRKKIIKNTDKEGIDYDFKDFLIEHGVSMLGGLLAGLFLYYNITEFEQNLKFIVYAIKLMAEPLIMFLLLAIFILINYYFHKKLELEGK